MSADNQSPLPSLKDIAEEYKQYGMKIVAAREIGGPLDLRKTLGLKRRHFAVCGFMGSSPGIDPAIRQVAKEFPQLLGRLDKEFDLQMPLVSGGGNWVGTEPGDNTGLMGQWAYGATRNNRKARFIITRGLVQKEGLPKSRGISVCLEQMDGDRADSRLGVRTDALEYAGDLFLDMTGGNGTDAERLILGTNMTITNEARLHKLIIFNPLCRDQETGEKYRFREADLTGMWRKHRQGQISRRSMDILNDNVIVYNPPPDFDPQAAVDDLMKLTMFVRDTATAFNPAKGYAPLHPEVRKRYLRPLSDGSTISQPFPQYAVTRSWGNLEQVTPKSQLQQLTAHL